MATYEYFINLDERGEFYADVRNADGETVFETNCIDIFEDGFMRHKTALDGLKEYLVSLSIITKSDNLVEGQGYGN